MVTGMYTGFDDLVMEKVEAFLDQKDVDQDPVTVFIDGELGEKWLEYGVEINGEEETIELYQDLDHLSENQIQEIYRSVVSAFDNGFESYDDGFIQ